MINTSKSLLQSEGSKILGRFFIALTAQAVIKRATLPETNRIPFMVYIDEAQEYIDQKIEDMLNQSRKYKVGFTLSHQNLNQLGFLKHTVFSSTSIKLAGGISAKDGIDLAHEMKTTKDFLLSMKKIDNDHTQFACYVKNHTNHAAAYTFPFGLLENQPTLNTQRYQQLIDHNRSKYCQSKESLHFTDPHAAPTLPAPQSPIQQAPIKIKQPPPANTPPHTPTVIPNQQAHKHLTEESTQHRYLQNLVKRMGQQRGFHTVVEASVFDGLGKVDVTIEGYDTSIAVEVSVTTQSKWEAGNISKCFSAGFEYVIVMCSEQKHLHTLQQKCSKEFKNQIHQERLLFVTAESLLTFLDSIKAGSLQSSNTVAGYTVKTTFTPLHEAEAKIREESLAKILIGATNEK